MELPQRQVSHAQQETTRAREGSAITSLGSLSHIPASMVQGEVMDGGGTARTMTLVIRSMGILSHIPASMVQGEVVDGKGTASQKITRPLLRLSRRMTQVIGSMGILSHIPARQSAWCRERW